MNGKQFTITMAFLGVFFFWTLLSSVFGDEGTWEIYLAQEKSTEDSSPIEEIDDFLDEQWPDEIYEEVADPLEPINRVFFQFNDRLYFWVLKPVATIYSKILPRDLRSCIRNAFDNLLAPVRVANNFLQGKLKKSGIEATRFVINSTLGIVGLVDSAQRDFGFRSYDEDFGQTLGVYGLGPSLYIHWPILGPSTARDTLGLVGDYFLDPLTYLTEWEFLVTAGIYGGKRLNQVSLTLGDYELFKETSLDPYAAMRDAYQQYRQGRIMDKNDNEVNYLDSFIRKDMIRISRESFRLEPVNGPGAGLSKTLKRILFVNRKMK